MQGSVRSETFISSAFEQLAKNAERIGQLNISPDLLSTLLSIDKQPPDVRQPAAPDRGHHA